MPRAGSAIRRVERDDAGEPEPSERASIRCRTCRHRPRSAGAAAIRTIRASTVHMRRRTGLSAGLDVLVRGIGGQRPVEALHEVEQAVHVLDQASRPAVAPALTLLQSATRSRRSSANRRDCSRSAARSGARVSGSGHRLGDLGIDRLEDRVHHRQQSGDVLQMDRGGGRQAGELPE